MPTGVKARIAGFSCRVQPDSGPVGVQAESDTRELEISDEISEDSRLRFD